MTEATSIQTPGEMGTRHGAVPASEPSAEEVGLMSKSPPNGLTMIVRLPGSEPRGKLSRMPPDAAVATRVGPCALFVGGAPGRPTVEQSGNLPGTL